MIETVFRVEDVPAPERFERWREMACASHAPAEVHTDHTGNFRAGLRLLGLGPVQAIFFDCLSLRSRRTPRLIRQFDPELYCLSFVLRGDVTVTHGGREAILDTASLTLSTTSRPLQGRIHADGGPARVVDVVLPRRLLPLPEKRVDRLLAMPLSGRAGPGALFAQFLRHLAAESARYRPPDAPRLGNVALDLVSALLAHHLESSLPPEAHRHALLLRVQAFVQRHLGDPDLTPGRIAAAHHISVRSLHRLFQQHGITVAAFIRRQRLERARRDLADPLLRAYPVHAIAARSGFPRPADFTRAFRTVYGTPPRDYRRMVLGDEATGAAGRPSPGDGPPLLLAAGDG